MGRLKDLTGQKFDRLTIIKRVPKPENSNHKCAYWLCQCDCGNQKVVRGDHLRLGKIHSCGCLHAENCAKTGKGNLDDLTGQRFTHWTVLYRDSNKIMRPHGSVYWICKCDCGNIVSVDGGKLRTGESQSCGCEKLSHGALKIKAILEQNNINYQLEYKFSDLVGKQNVPYRFDFAIFHNNKLNYLIEYDSSIHYEANGFITEERLKMTQQRDMEKNQYCIKNNIVLYRIPYFELNNIDTLQDILQDKYKI